MSRAPETPSRPRGRVLLAFALLMALVFGVLAEGGARLWSAIRERRDRAPAPAGSPLTPEQADALGRALDLDPYEMADPLRPGRWRLRPGYRATFAEMLAAKRAAGRVLTVRHMKQAGPKLGIAPSDTAVEVNADGFRGPALEPAHGRVRILALGDSCTFGTPLSERYPYTRVLEQTLRAQSHDVEVVNGGVEGYSPADVLARAHEFEALRPELTTLYIGWNALYRESFLADASGPRRYLHSARLLSRLLAAARGRFTDARQAALDAYGRPRRADRGDEKLRLLDDYEPSFLGDVARIAERMQSTGSRVVMLTLPGLFATARDPSPRALAIGHLPIFSDNAFVLARMAERYNEALRALAHERGILVVDLERWASEALVPSEDRFIDSVHLDELGQQELGRYLAEQLGPLLPQPEPAPPPSR